MPSAITSASVYLRQEFYYVHPLAGSGGGDPVLFMEPVTKLEATADATVLGNCVLQALRLSHHRAPWPTDWKGIADPLYRAASVRSLTSFLKKCTNVRVDLESGTVTILPTTSKEYPKSFSPLVGKELTFELGDAHALGLAVAHALSISD